MLTLWVDPFVFADVIVFTDVNTMADRSDET
jgi:hypothetical protein